MIEALIGLCGVALGSVIAVSKEYWMSWLERRRNASFAAIRVVGVLDQFVETCVDIVSDDGTVQGRYAGRTKDGEEYAIPQFECPSELEYPDDINWRDLDSPLMYRVLMLPSKIKKANRYIQFWAEEASPPSYDEVFEARQESYAELGLEAIELANALRSAFDIPIQAPPSWNADWDAKVFLSEKKKSIEERNKRSNQPFEVKHDE